jgi:hypothetical protein
MRIKNLVAPGLAAIAFAPPALFFPASTFAPRRNGLSRIYLVGYALLKKMNRALAIPDAHACGRRRSHRRGAAHMSDARR